MSAAALLAALTAAPLDLKSCIDDPRFTQDMSPGANARTRVLQAAMRAVCDECPLFDLCEQTAQQLQPTAGFWAGKSYNRHTLTPGDRRGLHG